jgi:hypothetical protein
MDNTIFVLAGIGIGLAAVWFFLGNKKTSYNPVLPTPNPTQPGNVFDGGSADGVTTYQVFAPDSNGGDVTYTDANGNKVTAIVMPPSITIEAKDGFAIDGNYGIITKVG